MKKYWHYATQWLWQTPERALNAAYQAVLEIKKIENDYFGGKQVSLPSEYNETVVAYIQSELTKYLQIAQARLNEFKLSSFILNLSPINSSSKKKSDTLESESIADGIQTIEVKAVSYSTIEKLNLIDKTLSKYKEFFQNNRVETNSSSQTNKSIGDISSVQLNEQETTSKAQVLQIKSSKLISKKESSLRKLLDKYSVLPRSIGRTVGKLAKDLNPNAESEVIQEFRKSRSRTVVSIRYLLILVLLPLLANQFSKVFLISPVMNSFWNNNQANIFLNSSQEERALAELKTFEERIRFDFLAGNSLGFTPELTEKKLKEKVTDLAHKYSSESVNAVKNIFADMFSVATFAAIVVTGKRHIVTLKTFIDELIYGLSDSAKAFLIILFTDLFVGFHSSHGWEVILENTLNHFGLPENKDFIFMFIATFPVILDSIFKYWIFRYLNRISPSAVATYRNMNE